MLHIQQGDVYATCADTTKLIKSIEYTPNILLNEGITEFVRWYKEYFI